MPFLGAGLGMSCGLPNWSGLLRQLATWSVENNISLSQGALIEHSIVQGSLDAAAHALGQALGARLTDALRSILAPPELKPTLLHSLLADVLWPMVLTTNFDNLLPTSFASRLEPLTWQDNSRMGEVLRTGQPHLMMVHGWIERPESIVLTPSAYRASFNSAAQRHYLATLLSHYSFLFLGCSLRDPDVKYFLEELRYAFGPAKVPHFALIPSEEVDELQVADLYDNYSIQVLTYTPTRGHPEVEEFVRRTIDVLPPTLLHDPLVKVKGIQTAKLQTANCTPTEFLTQFRYTCDKIAASGFLRTAWSALSNELQTNSSASAEVRLRTAIRVVEMMRQDQVFDFAIGILQRHANLCEDPTVQNDLRSDFEILRFRTFLDQYDLVEAQNIYTHAASSGVAAGHLEEMRSSLVIADFLHAGRAPESPGRGSLELIAYLEARAMHGDIEFALTELAIAADDYSGQGNTEAAVQLRNKRAELLYLACRNEEAWNEFEQHITPLEHSLPIEQRAQLQRNQMFAGFILGKQPAAHSVHANYDLHASTREETAHAEHLLSAEGASRERKHYDSLPPLWRQLRRAHGELNWSACKLAHDRLALDVFAAGWIREAVYHAILANSEACLKELGELLIKERNGELITVAVDYILKNCKLPRHSAAACTLLSSMTDILPETQMPEIIQWLVRAALQTVSNRDAETCATAAWNVLRAIVPRIPVEEATTILQFARTHPSLSSPCFGREAILETLHALVVRGASYIPLELGRELLPIATTVRWDHDYQHILRLLARIAEKSTETRDLLRAALFDPNVTTDVMLASYATSFGHRIDGDMISRSIVKIAERLPLQVYAGQSEAPPFQLSSYGTQQSGKADDRVCIQMQGGILELNYVAAHKHQVCSTTLDPLVSAVVALIANPLNNRTNRLMLINFLIRIRERLSPEQKKEAYQSLRPFAIGQASPSPAELPQSRSTDRMQWNTPSPTEEQALALHAMTLLREREHVCADAELAKVLQDALFDADPMIRQHACASIADLPSLSAELDLPLITATLDGDWRVAGAALHAVVRLLDQGSLQAHTPLLITITTKARTAQTPLVRALAAKLTVRLAQLPMSEEQRATLTRIQHALQADISYQVRTAAAESDQNRDIADFKPGQQQSK